MESIRNFLESSTIHGLSYISTTRKYVRVFWILVVIGGFSGAGVLIFTAFQSWADSPVKTTIETHPISEITFPKVTVCPPKNTFTNLNYRVSHIIGPTLFFCNFSGSGAPTEELFTIFQQPWKFATL